ncbi:hypothetical protein [Proteiniphilum sp.]|uniref:hypothetical protein n=1 Tax=Proteiniphilum sp. TaxID=1926877 RepID=UPI003332D101
MILPEDIEVELRKKWPRKKRQEMERRWSFSEIINEITMKYRGTPLESIAALSYGYRMSSHVIHGDETAIQIIEERNNRSEEDRDKAYRGHFLRLFSDCLAFTTLTGALTMSYLKLNKEMEYFLEIMQEVKIVEGLEAKYKGKVFEESYYDRYRSTSKPHS